MIETVTTKLWGFVHFTALDGVDEILYAIVWWTFILNAYSLCITYILKAGK